MAPCDGYATNIQLVPGAVVSAAASVVPFVCERDDKNRGVVVASFMQGLTVGAVSVRSQVADKTAAARQKATSAGAARKGQLRNRAAAVSAPAWQATPEQVRRAVTNGASGAKEHWIPLTLAAGVLIVGCLALRQWSSQASSRLLRVAE